MNIVIIVFSIILLGFLMDKLGLWLEQKGYLYYRRYKPKGGAMGNSLLELNALLSPSNRTIVEIKQNEVIVKKNKENAPNEPIELSTL